METLQSLYNYISNLMKLDFIQNGILFVLYFTALDLAKFDRHIEFVKYLESKSPKKCNIYIFHGMLWNMKNCDSLCLIVNIGRQKFLGLNITI